MWRGLRVYSGICPDPECHTKLYFPSYASSSVECTGCGQHHAKDSLLNVEDIQDPDVALRSLLRSVLLGQTPSKTTPDLVKVKGYSNYHCKLLSPLLTHYGMDKRTGEGKLLSEMGQGEVFDCAVLGDRAFQIESEHMETAGYGRDETGSLFYLNNTLETIKLVNDNEERLVPIHVDGDGHCLVHAISRALVGREIFWHALRTNLKNHLKTELHKYKGLFRDFIRDDEWEDIISEADPYFEPPDGEGLGLRNIHLFGLANVLHRPIILLDSVSGMQSSGDYTGIFLPALIPEEKCKRDNILNKPLAVAWSSSGRNHFIPLVGVKGKPVPKLPHWVIPKAWGIPNEVVKQYVDFDSQGNCCIGGDRCLQEKYLQRLVKAMDDLFTRKYSISAQLVTEVHQFVYKPSGMVGIRPETVTNATKLAVTDGRLHRCLSCNALCELHVDISPEMLKPGGEYYNIALQTHGPLKEGLSYSFPSHELVCTFDAERDTLVAVKHKDMTLLECHLCHGPLRRVKSDGSALYMNGDRTATPVEGRSRCHCGFKHYWSGRLYDNMPESFPISLEWGGQTVSETVYWFQYEEDPSLNSNVYDVAAKLVQKHFPGEFGSERLVQKVVDIILRKTARKEQENKGARPDFVQQSAVGKNSDQDSAAVSPFTPSKIILTGEKKKTMHKEELTMSETERVVKTRTEHHAAVMQKRRSGEGAKKLADKEAKVAKQQPVVKSQQVSPQASPTKGDDSRSVTSQPVQPAVKRTEKKVRLSTSEGKQSMITLGLNTTFKQLQDLIEKELGLPASELRIRFGFPPRELHPPGEGHEDDPVPLQHGDRVMVEHLKPVVPEEQPPDVVMSELKAEGGEGNSSSETGAEARTQQQREAQNTAVMASALLDALTALGGADVWEAAQNCHEMFDRGGYYYNKVANDLGPLKPNQHCTLRCFPNKVFAYNAEKDRLDLCLGQRHIQVQPLDDETLLLAHTRPTQTPADERASSMSTEASFSGAIGHRDTSHARVAFSGEGRTLSSVSSSHTESPKSPQFVIQVASTRSPPTAMDSPMADVDNEVFEENQENPGAETSERNKEVNVPSESMVSEQAGLKTLENASEVPIESPASEMLAGTPEAVTHDVVEMNETQLSVEPTMQREEGRVIETEVPVEMAVENEKVEVKSEEAVQDMLVETQVAVMQEATAGVPVENTDQLIDGQSVENDVTNVTRMQTENMDINQDQSRNDVDDDAAVSDLPILKLQSGKVEDQTGESTDLTSESMETDQVSSHVGSVTQSVTPHVSSDQYMRVVEASNQGAGTNDTSVECTDLTPRDGTTVKLSVAMEIDAQGESDESKSVQASGHATDENQAGNNQLSEIAHNAESSELVNRGDAALVNSKAVPSVLTDGKTAPDYDKSEGSA